MYNDVIEINSKLNEFWHFFTPFVVLKVEVRLWAKFIRYYRSDRCIGERKEFVICCKVWIDLVNKNTKSFVMLQMLYLHPPHLFKIYKITRCWPLSCISCVSIVRRHFDCLTLLFNIIERKKWKLNRLIYVVWVTLYIMYFNVSSVSLKNLEILCTSYSCCLQDFRTK